MVPRQGKREGRGKEEGLKRGVTTDCIRKLCRQLLSKDKLSAQGKQCYAT